MYESYATYIDLPDDEVIRNLHQLAVELYNRNKDVLSDLDDSEIAKIKEKHGVVLYGTTVSKRTMEDMRIARVDMNGRLRRRYLIIDADFNYNEEEASDYAKQRFIDVCEKQKAPYFIYPTLSYPEKPRWRGIVLTKNLLNESSYYKAISWLYSEMGVRNPEDYANVGESILDKVFPPLERTMSERMDAGNKNIRSNNNAPLYINEEQVTSVIDRFDIEEGTPLTNDLWKNQKAPRKKKGGRYATKTKDDSEILSDDFVINASIRFGKSADAQNYETFWQFLHSVARAEYHSQITEEQVALILRHVAQSDVPYLKAQWILKNPQMYRQEKVRVFESESYLANAKPLLKWYDFKP